MMSKSQKIRLVYYGLFALAIVLVLTGAWLRYSTGSTYGLLFVGMAIWLWLRFGDHDWPKEKKVNG